MTRFDSLVPGFIFLVSVLISWGSSAVAKPPTLDHLFPAGGERGRTVEVTASGTFERWPVRCWVDGRGVVAEALPEKGKLSLTIAADAPAGVHRLRLHDEEGATAPRPFIVGVLPEVPEAEPNNDPTTAQAVDSQAVIVNGRLGRRGDVDSFAVALCRGQTLVASMEANRRIGSPIDGLLQVVSSDGFVLASSDDDHELDPQIVFIAPDDGRYVVRAFGFPATPGTQIALAGGESSIYRLTLTTGGFLDHAFPLAISRAGTGQVEATGWNIPEAARTHTVLACDACEDEEFEVSHPLLGNAALVRLEPHATLVEAEPNGDESPQPVPIPMTITGRIDPARDRDVFQFSAKKGQTLTIRVESRSLGQPLDPILRVTDSVGKLIAEVDDPGRGAGRGARRRRGADLGRDPELAFTAPGDGDYRIEVRDLFDHGGMRHVYRLSAVFPEPDYALSLAEDRYTWKPDKPLGIPVTVERRNGFGGPIDIQATGLPEGVSSAPVTSQPGDSSAKSVTLQFASASCPWSGPFRIVGKPSKDGQGPSRSATISSLGVGTSFEWAWLTIVKP